jgi:hypothetical protein
MGKYELSDATADYQWIKTTATGVSLGFNLFNALVTLVLGVPGLGLLLLVQWVLT